MMEVLSKPFLYIPIGVYVVWVTYVLVMSWVREEATTAETYAVGERDYYSRAVFYSLIATMIGPTYTIGIVSEVSEHGYYYVVFFLLVMVSMFVVGTYFAGEIQSEIDSRTVGDIIRKYYDRSAKLFTGVVTVTQQLAITGLLCLGGSRVLKAVWGVPDLYGILAIALAVTIYSALGGMPVVVRTDRFQFGILFLVLLGAIAVSGLFFANPQANFLDLVVVEGGEIPVSEALGVGAAFLLGETFLPIYSNRGLISASESDARKGFQYAAVFGVVWFVFAGIVGIASHVFPTDGPYNIILFDVYANSIPYQWMSNLMVGLLVTGILAVVMASMDSVLNAGAVSFSRDIIESYIDLSEEEEFVYDKFAVFGIGFVGTSFALFFESIIDIAVFAFTVWVPTVVFPLGYCLVNPNGIKNVYAGMSSILAGVGGWCIAKYLISSAWVPPILFGLLLNILIFYSVNNLTRG